MGSDWRKSTIQSLIDEGIIIGHKDGNYGSLYPKAKEFGTEGVPFLTAKSLSGGRIDIDNAPRLGGAKASKLKFGFIEADDVLLSHNATVGRVAVVPQLTERVLIGTSLTYYRLNHAELLPRYLAAYFSGRDFQNELAATMSHTTRNQVPITAQRKLTIVLPPLPEQKAIAHILGSLDDKIELNRQMNTTLEEMAQALFKSWFVDFDPVIDNALVAGNPIPEELADRAEVRRKALADGTANREVAKQFPDAFQLTEQMGWIPEGWEATPLGKVASILNGYAFKSGDYTDDGIFVLRTRNFDANGLASRLTDDVFLPNSFMNSHDSYLSQAFDFHLVMVGASIGKTSLLLPHMLPALRNQNMWCFRPKSNFGSRFFLNLAVQKKVTEVLAWASGSARSFFRKRDFQAHEILVPPEELLIAFENITTSMFLCISNNCAESQNLSKLRDTLLPKLISGELRIPDAEKLVEEVLAV